MIQGLALRSTTSMAWLCPAQGSDNLLQEGLCEVLARLFIQVVIGTSFTPGVGDVYVMVLWGLMTCVIWIVVIFRT